MAGRNPLVDQLLATEPSLEVADFGCGPGNLIPHVAGHFHRLTGVDQSATALGIAADLARQYGLAFEPYVGDIRTVGLPRRFDIVVSVNAVLPATRAEVVELFDAIKRNLKPTGRLLAILPSYDTTRYVRRLIAERDGDDAARAWDVRHKADERHLLFADDGRTPQAYHSPESIADELPRAGLRLVGEPVKVHYPWELTQRFDYGYFPDAPEEIWDWYVEAQIAP
jgi:SAM-dependent methyltransferase